MTLCHYATSVVSSTRHLTVLLAKEIKKIFLETKLIHLKQRPFSGPEKHYDSFLAGSGIGSAAMIKCLVVVGPLSC